jgi:hypothetical protein
MLTKTKRPARRAKPRFKRSVFDEIAEFLASSPSREAILDFHPSPALQRRASQLLEKNREGTLTDEDRRDLEEFGHAESLFRRLKAQMRGVKRA